MEYIIVLIFIGTGLSAIIKPSLSWEISEKWKTKDAEEPSEAYLLKVRLGGVITILLAFGMFAGILLKKYYFN